MANGPTLVGGGGWLPEAAHFRGQASGHVPESVRAEAATEVDSEHRRGLDDWLEERTACKKRRS